MKIFILCDVFLFQETLLQLHHDDDDEDMNGTSFTSFAMMCSFKWKYVFAYFLINIFRIPLRGK